MNFHARVAALARLGVADEAALAETIRRGAMDNGAADLTSCRRAIVSHRLTAAHPGYEQEKSG